MVADPSGVTAPIPESGFESHPPDPTPGHKTRGTLVGRTGCPLHCGRVDVVHRNGDQ